MKTWDIGNEYNFPCLPGLIEEDNQGAIFLAKNSNVIQCAKHVDIRCYFICEFVEKKNRTQDGQIFKVDSNDNTTYRH